MSQSRFNPKPVQPPLKATRLEKLLILLLLVVAADLGRRLVLHYTEQSVVHPGTTQVIVVESPMRGDRSVTAVPVWSNPPVSNVRTALVAASPEPPSPPREFPRQPIGSAPQDGANGGAAVASSLKRFDLGSRTIGVEFFSPGAITMIAVPDEGADSGDGGDGSTVPP